MTEIEFLNSELVRNTINELANSIRAERNESDSFLDIYADKKIIDRLLNHNNQIIYGRRGSGKTHLLLALAESIVQNSKENYKSIPIYIDLRKLLPLITDANKSKEETSVLIFQHIINNILTSLTKSLKYIFNIEEVGKESLIEKLRKEKLIEILEKLNIEFDGRKIKKLGALEFNQEEINKIAGSLKLSKDPNINFDGLKQLKSLYSEQYIKYISFSEISKYLDELLYALNDIKIVCLLDEWSELPIDLQPYISELLKRTFIASNYTLKIAAIPYRSNFRDTKDETHKIGLEEGGDIFPLSLDNRYIFETNKNGTRDFYNELLVKHIKDINPKMFDDINEEKFINIFFANQALAEILVASAGIPRDFMHLFILSYNNRTNLTQRIILKNIRSSTSEWYSTDKKEEVEKDKSIKYLFEGIVNEIVIGKKKTHFLLPQKYSDNPYIKKLVDLRVLHIRQKGISHKHIINRLYDVYSIDYGSYTSLDISKNTLDTDFQQLTQDLKTIEDVRDARSLSLEDDFFNKFILAIGEGLKCNKCSETIDTKHLAFIKQNLCNHCFEPYVI
jgi:hypothetical protein